MAWTHALAFFVAKGMIDAGAGMEVPFAPPSFQAIARTIEIVRSDAGHLFADTGRSGRANSGFNKQTRATLWRVAHAATHFECHA